MPSNTANSSPTVTPNNQYQLPTMPAANTILSGADTAEPPSPSQSLAGPNAFLIIVWRHYDGWHWQSFLATSTNTNEPNQWLCNRNSLLLWNACSLMNKFNQFQSVVYTKNFDIICVNKWPSAKTCSENGGGRIFKRLSVVYTKNFDIICVNKWPFAITCSENGGGRIFKRLW